VSPVELADVKGGRGEERGGAIPYDGEKAWSFRNHAILSETLYVYKYTTTYNWREIAINLTFHWYELIYWSIYVQLTHNTQSFFSRWPTKIEN
jgi:hypothetical protein